MTGATYIDTWRPLVRRQALIFDILAIFAGSLLMALLAQIRIPVPFSPVPVTGQTFGVLLLGTLLGSKRGAIAMIAYLLEGISGLPVFAGGGFGLVHLAGPTGGYLVGFVAAAYVCGYLAEHGWDRQVWTTIAAMTIGTAIIFLVGVFWLAQFVGFEQSLPMGLYPFVIGGLIKITLASVLLPLGWKILGKR